MAPTSVIYKHSVLLTFNALPYTRYKCQVLRLRSSINTFVRKFGYVTIFPTRSFTKYPEERKLTSLSSHSREHY